MQLNLKKQWKRHPEDVKFIMFKYDYIFFIINIKKTKCILETVINKYIFLFGIF